MWVIALRYLDSSQNRISKLLSFIGMPKEFDAKLFRLSIWHNCINMLAKSLFSLLKGTVPSKMKILILFQTWMRLEISKRKQKHHKRYYKSGSYDFWKQHLNPLSLIIFTSSELLTTGTKSLNQFCSIFRISSVFKKASVSVHCNYMEISLQNFSFSVLW